MNTKIWKYTSRANAESFRDRANDTMVILLGDDNKYWVVTGRQAHNLIKAGYSVA